MTLHIESNHIHLVTDPTLVIYSSEGRLQGIVPYRLGVPPIFMRCDVQGVVRLFPGMLPTQVQHILALQNGSPLTITQHLKKMQPYAASPQRRISSGGGMCPPSMSAANSQQHQPQLSPTRSLQSQTSPQILIKRSFLSRQPESPCPLPSPFPTAFCSKWRWSCHIHAAC
jgi:hypothetical protein